MEFNNFPARDDRSLQYQDLTIDEHLELIDAVVGKIEVRTDEFSAENGQFVVEVANRLNSLANHFRPMLEATLSDWFPHVPDEVLADAPGAHEGSPFLMSGTSSVHPAVGARLDEIMKPHDPLNGRQPTSDEIASLVDAEYALRRDSEPSIFKGGEPVPGRALGDVADDWVEEEVEEPEER